MAGELRSVVGGSESIWEGWCVVGLEECVGRNGGVWWKGWKCVAGEVEVYERGRSVVGGVRCVVGGVEECGGRGKVCGDSGGEVWEGVEVCGGRDRGMWWE